jgi:hypothetical protein
MNTLNNSNMNNLKLVLTSMALVFAFAVSAQSTGDAVAKKVGVYVFPAQGQTDEQLHDDESYCYTWAVKQSGYDPINPTVVVPDQVNQGPDGSAVRGSAKGALAGAAIGAISGDAGQGAAIGAVSGAMVGHRHGRMRKGMAQAGADQVAYDQTQQLVDGFKKAFSVCLEGKGYTVK